GKDTVRRVLAVSLVIITASFFIQIQEIRFILTITVVLLLLFTLYFFRDPERNIPSGISGRTVISPADGKIVLIDDIENKYVDFFGNTGIKQVSIFLSPLNVHVNCFPVNGTLKYYNYIKGNYIVAFDHKSSDKNERTELGIETEEGKKLIFKQIAGFVARRIVCKVRLGQEVKAGRKFGMIKFGSRVDILIPQETEIFVKIGDKVRAGMSIIAELT
ncbi:MAG: phosphatidylserine decarboxylase family protein, partial [Ignavibacteria bacterium]|nr:phosphatidylserine decarboxylase family protein [Ignavibacteria bacterium]